MVVAAAVTGQLFELPTLPVRSYLLLAGAGVIHYLVGRYALYRSISAIGVNRGIPVRAIATPYSVLAALLVLGERVSVVNAVGIAIIVSTPLIMFVPFGKVSGDATASKPGSNNPGALGRPSTPLHPQGMDTLPTPLLVEGYIFGILTGLAFGTSPLMIREAISGTGMGIAGALIAYSAASLPLLLSLALPGRLAGLRGMDRTVVRWFLLATVSISFAQIFRFVALDLTTVTVAVPLLHTNTAFTLLLGFLINRQLESFRPRVLAAIGLSVVGSVGVLL